MRLTLAFVVLVEIGGTVAAQNPAPAGAAPPAGASTIGVRMQAVAAQPDATGIGPYLSIKEAAPTDLDFVVYRPKDLNALGARKLGAHVWGNGGCVLAVDRVGLKINELFRNRNTRALRARQA